MPDLPERFKNFAVNCISIAIKQEYTNALGRWKKQNILLLKAAKTAFSNQQEYLKAIRAQQQQNSEGAMLALMLLGGPAFSWVSGAIQYRLAPRYLGNMTSTMRKVPNPKYDPKKARLNLPKAGKTIAPNQPKPTLPPPFRPGEKGRVVGPNGQTSIKPEMRRPADKPNEPEFIYKEVFDPNYGKTLGKVWGDFTGSLTERLAMHRVKQAVDPKDQREKLQASVDLAATVSLSSLESFESALDTVWEDAKLLGETGIANYAGTFYTDPTWGERFMAENQIKDGPDSPSNPLYPRLQRGMEIILDMLDEQRRVWAADKDWFFFGNDPLPVSPAYAENAMEAQMWAEWIESENFKLERVHSEHSDGVTRIDTHEATGASGISIDWIVKRLVKLGVVTAEAHYEVMRRTGAKHSNATGLQDAEVDDVDGQVDTDAELRSIRRWAVGRQPQFIGGGFGSIRRPTGRMYPTNIQI